MPGVFRRRPLAGGAGGRRFPGMGPRGRRFVGQGALFPEAQRQLAEANRLLVQGKPLDAAATFARVAEVAQQVNTPMRAAKLSSRAAQSYLSGGDPGQAVVQFRRAFSIAVGIGAFGAAAQLAHMAVNALRNQGLSAEAEGLHQEFDAQLQRHGLSLVSMASEGPSRPARLPSQCPACLGPVRSDEVEWIDDSSAECAYCGTVLRAE